MIIAAGVIAMMAVTQSVPAPIIDMHLHASGADAQGPPPVGICSPGTEFPTWDPERPYPEVFQAWLKAPPCGAPLWSPMTDEALLDATVEVLDRRNIYAVTSGAPAMLDAWGERRGGRMIRGLWFGRALRSVPSPSEMRSFFESGQYRVFAEVAIQYDGMSPSDPSFEPYLGIAEELDLPVGIHIGIGPPGAPHLYPVFGNYRASLHSPLVLEEALQAHPRVRVYVMHAGWPMIDDLLALLWAHPQVYVGVGAISHSLPRAEFHGYLERIVRAGFAKRVLFGSDQMVWPGAIERAIGAIESAPFLTSDQKRDILFNNAVRFLRLGPEEIRTMERGEDLGGGTPNGESRSPALDTLG